jgi:hypothetical protein
MSNFEDAKTSKGRVSKVKNREIENIKKNLCVKVMLTIKLVRKDRMLRIKSLRVKTI